MKSSKLSTLLLAALVITSCSTSIQAPNTDVKSVNNVSKASETKSNVELMKLTQADIVSLDHEYMSFSTKSLSAVYFQKKLVQLIASDNGVANGAKIVRELQYAQYKTESVIPFRAMSNTDPIFYTTLTNVAAVGVQRSGDSPFDVFIGNSNPYPAAPSGLNTSTVTSTSFTANWSAVSGAASYEISVDGAAPVNVGNVLTYAVSGLVAGSNHNFKVRVINSASLTGPYSSTFSFILAPDTPTGLTSTNIADTSFSANWSTVANATAYELVVDANAPVNVGNILTYSVTGLTPSTTHTFKVRALNNTLTGIYSATSGTITLLPATPVASVATNVNVTGFTANWTTVPSATSGYVLTVRRASNSNIVNIFNIASQATGSQVVTGLTTGTTYTYTVQAKNGSFLSADSNSMSVTADYTTSTFAGSSNGYADGTGTSAMFRNPIGGAVDSSGNIYIADLYNNSIRKITPAGDVTTFAGNGASTFDGNRGTADGTGTAARFSRPTGMTFDSSGNMYVADQSNNRIRMITSAGVVTTIATTGFGFVDPTATAVAPDGSIYVADQNSGTIKKIATDTNHTVTVFAGTGVAGSTDGPATVAQFHNPTGIVRDTSGNLYVSEQFTYKIRKIAPNGDVSTLAGSGVSGFADGTGAAAMFGGCYGLAIDGNNNLYVADYGNNRIRKITPTGVVTTLAGNGSATSIDGTRTSSQLNSPQGVAVNSSGTIIYAIEYSGNKIRKIE